MVQLLFRFHVQSLSVGKYYSILMTNQPWNILGILCNIFNLKTKYLQLGD